MQVIFYDGVRFRPKGSLRSRQDVELGKLRHAFAGRKERGSRAGRKGSFRPKTHSHYRSDLVRSPLAVRTPDPFWPGTPPHSHSEANLVRRRCPATMARRSCTRMTSRKGGRTASEREDALVAALNPSTKTARTYRRRTRSLRWQPYRSGVRTRRRAGGRIDSEHEHSPRGTS